MPESAFAVLVAGAVLHGCTTKTIINGTVVRRVIKPLIPVCIKKK